MAVPSTGNTFLDLLFGGMTIVGLAWGVNMQLGRDKLARMKIDGEGGWLRSALAERAEAQQLARQNFDLYRTEQQRADAAEGVSKELRFQHELDLEKINRLERQVDKLTAVVVELQPALGTWLRDSGFGDPRTQGGQKP